MADELAWVIEASWSQPGSPAYLFVRTDERGTHFAWTPEWNYTTDHQQALRFARKQDADAFVRALWPLIPQLFNGPTPVPQPRIAEHKWSA